MKFRRVHLSAALVIATLCVFQPAGAQSVQRHNAVNGLTAIGTAETIEVLTRAGTRTTDYFCAAGEFAKRKLGARGSDQVVLIFEGRRSVYQGNRRANGFTFVPQGGTVPAELLGEGGRVGQSQKVGTSTAGCGESRDRDRK